MSIGSHLQLLLVAQQIEIIHLFLLFRKHHAASSIQVIDECKQIKAFVKQADSKP